MPPLTPQTKRLIALLREHGVGARSASGMAAWSAFKAYGREAFGEPGAGLLFQVGTYFFSDGPLFYFDPVCQFDVTSADGEHDRFEQLHCEMTCPADEHVDGIETSLWSFDYPSAEAFFAAVEALPEFQVAAQRTDYRVCVTQEAV